MADGAATVPVRNLIENSVANALSRNLPTVDNPKDQTHVSSHQGSHSSERGGGVGLSPPHKDNARATGKPAAGGKKTTPRKN